MELFTQYATPYELSLTARVGQEERDRANQSLSSYLPVTTVMGQEIKIIQGENGLNEIAEYRAYDAENSFGGGAKGKELTVTLPPLGQQERVSEADQLAMRNITNPDLQANSQLKVAKRLGAAVADRLEVARGQVMEMGKFAANENGFIADIDFGRDPSMTATAATLWSDTANATPLDDLEQWVEAYTNLNGFAPGSILAPRKIMKVLRKNEQIAKTATNGQIAQIVNNAYVADYLADNEMPAIELYDRKYRSRDGKVTPILSPTKLLFLPPEEVRAGVTAMGTTLEATSPEYGIPQGEGPGIVVGAFQRHNPMGVYLNSAAIGIPVLENANAYMSVTVLDA